MRHHFADFLDRDGGHWRMVPNRERYAHTLDRLEEGAHGVTAVTVGKGDEAWQRIASFPDLEEVTFHEPSEEQLKGIEILSSLRRLRISHARPKDLAFLAPMQNLEELVLEYVSGVTDLAPLGELPQLRSLYLENLRKVKNFDGLSPVESLRYLAIRGTLDWKQPIENFEFLGDLAELQVLKFFQVITKASYPATLPFRGLKGLKQLDLCWQTLAVEEYAFLEEALPGVSGAHWGPFRRWPRDLSELSPDDDRVGLSDETLAKEHPEVFVGYEGKRFLVSADDDWIEFTGKGARRVKRYGKSTAQRCADYEVEYDMRRAQARQILAES